MSEPTNNIGIPNVNPPEKECDDDKCPFHGELALRGRMSTGKVVSTKMHKTVVIKREYDFFVPKYQRYERRNAKYSCHLPECLIDVVEIGDTVKVAECRKLSKTVSSVVIEKLGGK